MNSALANRHVDTVIMACRVALLILATGLFAALWSGDHPDRIAAVDRPGRVLVGTRTVDRVKQTPTVQSSSSEHGSNVQQTMAPLPEGISAGKFLIVDQFGRTQIRVVSDQDALLDGTSSRQVVADHYSVEVGGMRWHFIRFDTDVRDQDSVSSSTTSPVQ